MTTDFLEAARRDYVRINAATLDWVLDRPRLDGVYLNTKLNPLTLADYGPEDGLRGPDFLFGWIQGRGLEALALHAGFFDAVQPDLAKRLDAAARELYAALDGLTGASGHAYFCYDKAYTPIRRLDGGGWTAQSLPTDIYTFSDAFVAKGMVAAAARLALPSLDDNLDALANVIAAIEDNRFQIDEHAPLGTETLAAQDADFGPRMILLGAAGMLRRIGAGEAHTAFANRFIDHVLTHHYDPASGLLRNVPGGDVSNVGHGIEFTGFALDHLEAGAAPDVLETLENILCASFEAGYAQPGVALTVSVATGERLSPYCPWWTLPETIRTAALLYERTGSERVLAVWRTAHEAFFTWYWRETPPIAYQCRTADGPIDYVPATPDLDPGYHTGLSLLGAISAIDRMTSNRERD